MTSFDLERAIWEADPPDRPYPLNDPERLTLVLKQTGLPDTVRAASQSRQYLTAASFCYALLTPADLEWVIWEILIRMEATGIPLDLTALSAALGANPNC